MSTPSQSPSRWPLERVLFALAGTMTLVAATLGAFVSKWFLLLAVLVGVNQWLYVRVRRLPGVDRAAPYLPAALGDLPQPRLTTASPRHRARLARR